eukprot:COSAG02_NODE_4139_length_5725_cov_5.233914_6_plen_107_part_00
MLACRCSDTFEFDATLPLEGQYSKHAVSADTGDVCDDEDDGLANQLSEVETNADAQEQNDLVIDVTVPEGCCAGDLLAVDTPAGVVEIAVPEGHSEGESFRVTTPR